MFLTSQLFQIGDRQIVDLKSGEGTFEIEKPIFLLGFRKSRQKRDCKGRLPFSSPGCGCPLPEREASFPSGQQKAASEQLAHAEQGARPRTSLSSGWAGGKKKTFAKP